jgi:hypothetical protein
MALEHSWALWSEDIEADRSDIASVAHTDACWNLVVGIGIVRQYHAAARRTDQHPIWVTQLKNRENRKRSK